MKRGFRSAAALLPDKARPLSKLRSRGHELAKWSRVENVPSTVPALQLRGDGLQFRSHPQDPLRVRVTPCGAENVENARDRELRPPTMEVLFRPLQVAQGTVQPADPVLEDVPLMALAMMPESKGQAQLERHVEPGRRLNAAQVVEGNGCAFEQPKDPAWPALAAVLKLYGTPRLSSERKESRNQCYEDGFVIAVVRDVEENGLRVGGGSPSHSG